MKKFEDIDLVNYIVNKGATLKETAEFFEVSVDTIKKRMASIKNSLFTDSRILNELQEVVDNNTLAGRKKGGKSPNSGVVRTVDLETIARRAMIILSENMTIDMAADSFNIPPSTLHEHLELLKCEEYSELYHDLQFLYSYHNKYKTNFPYLNDCNRAIDAESMRKIQVKYSQKLENEKRK